MNYFDSNMSKSTNTVVHFDWKTVIYIYASRKCCTQFIGDEGDLATGRFKLQLMWNPKLALFILKETIEVITMTALSYEKRVRLEC
jgi:hypothetical protein